MVAACGGGSDDAASSPATGTQAQTSSTTTTTTSTTTTTLPPKIYSDGTSRTWDTAAVYLPGSASRTTLDRIPANIQRPVMIFLHGCAGMGSKEHSDWGQFLAAQGLVVVMPDSFARPSRPDSCGDLSDGGPIPEIHDMRVEEIEYAVEQAQRQSWFDGSNLFIMGYSEGAIAAVRTELAGLRGVIATSWTCTHWEIPRLHGIYLPTVTPLLTMLHESDDWFPSATVQGNCGEHMTGRPDAKNIMVEGHGHGTFHDDQVRREVAQFIRRLVEAS